MNLSIHRGTRLDASAASPYNMVLRPLDGDDDLGIILRANAGDPREYEHLTEVKGNWRTEPLFAVDAEWVVSEPELCPAFEESRRVLFEIRRQHLPTFAFDWLLRRTDEPSRYLVMGMYGDEEGASTLCRLHPEILKFARDHPAARYSAQDVRGIRVYRVTRFAL